MTQRVTNSLLTILTVALLQVLSGCSSDSEYNGSDKQNDGNNGLNYSDGARSNTGIPGALLASTAAFTAKHPELIDLDYLTDSNGFSTSLQHEADIFGRDFQSLGDVNGDGSPDAVFTTNKSTTVVFGGSNNLKSIDFNNLPNASGFTLDFPIRLRGVGDINDDGVGDIAWVTFDSVNAITGVRVVLGKRDGLKQALQSPVVGVDGFDIYTSIQEHDIRTVQSAGDLNNDGVTDLLIGSYGLNGRNHAAPNAWIIYGNASLGPSSIDASTLVSGQGLTLVSPLNPEQLSSVYDATGTGYIASLTGGFDLNGDGIDDIAVGTRRFDWIAKEGESRTYVVFGSSSRSVNVLDLTMLDGVSGLRLVTPRTLWSPYPDRVTSVGDIDGNGFNDLAIVSELNHIVVFGGTAVSGSVVNRSLLQDGKVMRIANSQKTLDYAHLSKVGDLDNNGVDDLGVAFSDGDAVIIYGEVESRAASIDLANPAGIELTRLQGFKYHSSVIADSPLVSLGDINNDGADDLGIGWGTRDYDAGLVEIGDINDDGVADLQIGQHAYTSVSLLRILYGFKSDGFTGVLAGTPDKQPVARIEEGFFNAMIGAADVAAAAAINSVNDIMQSGGDPGPTASACLLGSSGVATGEVNQFECTDKPLTFGYDWGGGKYAGSAEARFTAAHNDNGELQVLRYRSAPLPSGAPGGHPFAAYVDFEATGMLTLSNGRAEGEIPRPLSCSIDVASRITEDNVQFCADFIVGATRSLDSVFGANRLVNNVRLLP